MKRPYPSTVIVDGVSHPITVARLTRDQAFDFHTAYMQMQNRGARRAGLKKAAASEEEYERQEAAEVVDERKARDFLQGVTQAYVSVADDHAWEVDGRLLRTGADLEEVFAMRADVLGQFANAIRINNFLDETAKKNWNSRPVSAPSSENAPGAAPTGARPAPIVDAALPAATRADGAATAATASSGPEEA